MLANIRQARLSDLDELIYLIKAHAEFEKSSIEDHSIKLRIRKIIQDDQPQLHFFVAEFHQKLVGYCSVSLEFSTWKASNYVHMDCLFVTSEARGMNIGKTLFKKVSEFAMKRNINEVQWQTPDWNTNAHNFYKSLGASYSPKYRYVLTLND